MTNAPTEANMRLVSQYCDPITENPYTSDDVCSWDSWRSENASGKLAVHDLGFPIFLRASQIAQIDEYTQGDPYGVNGDAGEPTAFHQHRINWTIKLIGKAIGMDAHSPRILDVACGEGHITAEIRKAFPTAVISALDCSLTAIERATNAYNGIDFIVADAYLPPYAAAEFDIVVLNNIWEHVPDPMRLLAAVTRVLKRDGTVIISTPSRYRLGNLIRVLTGRPVKLISKHHVTEYTVGQMLEQLRFGGYCAEVVDTPVTLPTSTLSSLLVRKTIAPLVRAYGRLVGSHHSLDWTVFYLARRQFH
jgi:ubiquinone/menaquinone biosynthesis C-methylase UbiE